MFTAQNIPNRDTISNVIDFFFIAIRLKLSDKLFTSGIGVPFKRKRKAAEAALN